MPTEVGGGFYWVLRGACRVAVELRQPVIGTDTVLVSMMNNFSEFRKVLGLDSVGRVGHDPGNGNDSSRIELPPEAELELLRITREVHWQVFGWTSVEASSSVPRWADEVHTAVHLAMAIAVARGAPWVGPDHLLEALLADSTNTASHFLRQQGVDFTLLTEVAQRTWPVAGGESPRRALAELLNRVGVLIKSGRESQQRPTALTRRLAASAIRLVTQASPVLSFLEDEAIAETVRLAHDRTTLTHLILAVLVLEEQMAASGLRPTSEYLPSCDFLLRPFGLDRELVSVTIASIRQEGEIAPPQRRRSWRSSPKNPPWTLAAARAAETARGVAPAGSKVPVGSSHLLYAVLSDPDDSGRRLLREHSVDPVVVQELVARRLGVTSSSSGPR